MWRDRDPRCGHDDRCHTGMAHGPDDGSAASCRDNRADRFGFHPTGTNAGRFTWTAGGGDGGRLVADARRGNQYAGRQSAVRLHPVDPLGWGQAFFATAVATTLSALAPPRWNASVRRSIAQLATRPSTTDSSTTSSSTTMMPPGRGSRRSPGTGVKSRAPRATTSSVTPLRTTQARNQCGSRI